MQLQITNIHNLILPKDLIQKWHLQVCTDSDELQPLITDVSHLVGITQFFGFVPASVAQLDVPSNCRPGGRGFNARRGRQHAFVEIDHEIFSNVILSLPLIQEGQLSVSGERMCTILVNRLDD